MTLVRALLGRDEKAAADAITPRERDVVYNDLPLLGMYGALQLAPDYSASYEEIVRKQLWARIAVNKISYAIGRLPLKVYERDDQGVRRERDGALSALLDMPNDEKQFGHMPGFLGRVAYDLLVYGNAIIVKAQVAPSAAPLQLLPSCPRHWQLDADGTYIYRRYDQAREKYYKPWQVIHIIEPGPSSDGFGRSRLEAARLTLAIEYAAQRLGEATFNNGAMPKSIITVKGMTGSSADKQTALTAFMAQVKTRFGGVAKAGLPAVVEGDVDWKTIAHNLDDSAVVAHRQLTRQEIAALYDIPQPAIGILDESNFASIDALHVYFYQDTLAWPVRLIESALNRQLIRGVSEFAGQFVEFDLRAAMRGSHTQRITDYQTGINARIYTPDEVRGWENLPPMAGTQPEANQLQFPLNYGVAPTQAGKAAP